MSRVELGNSFLFKRLHFRNTNCKRSHPSEFLDQILIPIPINAKALYSSQHEINLWTTGIGAFEGLQLKSREAIPPRISPLRYHAGTEERLKSKIRSTRGPSSLSAARSFTWCTTPGPRGQYPTSHTDPGAETRITTGPRPPADVRFRATCWSGTYSKHSPLIPCRRLPFE